MLELFPGTKLTIGPPIEDGFYYDFESEHRFVPEDLPKIEARMREITNEHLPFVMSTHPSAEARVFWEKRGEKFKVEMIDDLKQPTVTYCSHGSFVDLCRGGHVDFTDDIKYFKLLKISGAYWRADEKREQLQRLYGTAWNTQADLDGVSQTIRRSVQARTIVNWAPSSNLFTILPEDIGPGLIFWLPKGATLRRIIEEYLRELLEKNNYQFVVTPHIASSELWKTSGHWDFYRDGMFPVMSLENREYLLKPMNCPGHIQIYKHALHSYRELPVRITEMGTVYRNERTGVMHGLMRVRGFTQDDAHIFCRLDQIGSEVENILDLTLTVLKTFGFTDYQVSLSTRPEKYVGVRRELGKSRERLSGRHQIQGLGKRCRCGRGRFLRSQDRFENQGLSRALLAMLHRPSGFQFAGTFQDGLSLGSGEQKSGQSWYTGLYSGRSSVSSVSL